MPATNTSSMRAQSCSRVAKLVRMHEIVSLKVGGEEKLHNFVMAAPQVVEEEEEEEEEEGDVGKPTTLVGDGVGSCVGEGKYTPQNLSFTSSIRLLQPSSFGASVATQPHDLTGSDAIVDAKT